MTLWVSLFPTFANITKRECCLLSVATTMNPHPQSRPWHQLHGQTAISVRC